MRHSCYLPPFFKTSLFFFLDTSVILEGRSRSAAGERRNRVDMDVERLVWKQDERNVSLS